MFTHILAPTDLTDRSLPGIEAAGGLAASFGARVTLLHVIETIPGATFDELADFYGKLEERARSAMAAQLGRAQSNAVEVAQRVVYGRRAREILAFAAEEQVDLIVLASHQHDASRSQAMLGAISHRVAMLATCDVLLVK